MIDGVIFDMDGVIVDSEYAYAQEERAFLDAHGIDVPDEEIARINASGNEELVTRERLERMNRSEKFALLDQATMAFAIAPELFT